MGIFIWQPLGKACRLVLASWIAAVCLPLQAASPATAEAVRHNVQAFDDAAALVQSSVLRRWAAPPAQVLALGEACHDGHEFLVLRNRLFQHLVEHAGVRLYVAETGLVEAEAVDRYINGQGELHDATVAAVYFGKVFAENRALIEWMRRFNARVEEGRPIRFHGIDLAGVGVGPAKRLRVGLDRALAYLAQVDPAAAQRLGTPLQPLLLYFAPNASAADYQIDFPPANDAAGQERVVQMREMLRRGIASLQLEAIGDGHQDALDDVQRNTLTAGLADLQAWFEAHRMPWSRHSSADAYEHAYRGLLDAVAIDRNLRGYRAYGMRTPEWPTIRDFVMAENVKRLLVTLAPGERMFVFAHNVHLDRRVEGSLMGAMLHQALGSRYRVIATSASGACRQFPEWGLLDEQIRVDGPDAWLFDLKAADAVSGTDHARSYDVLVHFREWQFSDAVERPPVHKDR